MRGASQDRKRQPENNERVCFSPRYETSLCETNRSDRGNERVQGQCRWPDDIGRVPSKPHRPDVSGGTGLAEGRIRRGDDRDCDLEEELLQGHVGSRTSSGVGIIRVGIEKLLAVDHVAGDHGLSVGEISQLMKR
jgi:hypothetical protein